MFENLSYKQKLAGLGIVLIMLLMVANKRSFRATKDAYRQMKEVESQLAYMKASSFNSKELQTQIALYDDLIGQQHTETYVVQQSILDFANKFPKITIMELSETHLAESNGFVVKTNQLILEGDFQSLTETVYDFEKRFKNASLVSVSFLKERDFKKRKNRLRVKLIFQNYEKHTQ